MKKVTMAYCSNCPELLNALKREEYISDKVYECINKTQDCLKDALEVIVKYCPENDEIKTYLKTAKAMLEIYREEKVKDERGSDNAGQV